MKKILLLLLLMAWPITVGAHSYVHNNIAIGHVWALPAEKGRPFGIFMPIVNRGMPDRLVGFETPACAGAQSFHRAPDASPRHIDLPKGRPINLSHSGLSLRCYEAARDLKKGDRIKVTLRFDKAPPVLVEAYIEPSPYAP